jgi:hypothetical protein
MKMYANWAHGNSVTMGSPDAVSRFQHQGGGVEIVVKQGKLSWFHIPIPSPVVIGDVRSQLERVYILFEASNGGHITEVQVHDGPTEVHAFKSLSLQGTHIWSLDSANTFNLPALRSVRWGIAVSFLFVADNDAKDTLDQPLLKIGAVGGDFMV